MLCRKYGEVLTQPVISHDTKIIVSLLSAINVAQELIFDAQVTTRPQNDDVMV